MLASILSQVENMLIPLTIISKTKQELTATFTRMLRLNTSLIHIKTTFNYKLVLEVHTDEKKKITIYR